MLSRRGSVVVEYLMFIALVAAVAVPIFISKFGLPLLQTFKNERSKFVAIIGQTPKGRRKPPVPAEWFSQTPLPKIQPEGIPEGEAISESQSIETGQISGGTPIQPGQIGSGSSIGGGQGIQTGAIQTGEGGAGGSGGGRYSGAGTAGSGGMAGGDDFFSKPPTAPGKKMRGEKSEDEGDGGGSGRDSGGGEGETFSGRGDSTVEGGKKNQQEKAKGEGEGTRLGEGKKRGLVEAENELDERAKAKKFDWWLIVKILIIVFILALIFLIVIGNSRK
ncbi:MAG: hypothetical protein ACKN9V_07050 [Pseudomonadota bacterium]